MKTQLVAAAIAAIALGGLMRSEAAAHPEIQVRFGPEADGRFVEVVNLVMGTQTVAAEGDAYRLRVGDRGGALDYAAAFEALPYAMSLSPKAQPAKDGEEKPYVEGEILVKFKPTVSEEAVKRFNAEHGVKTLDVIRGIGVHRLQLPPGKSVEEMVRVYQQSGLVEFAEPNQKVGIPPMPGQRRTPPDQVKVLFNRSSDQPLPSLLSLVYGAKVIETQPQGARLAPPAGVSAEQLARSLRLCPYVASAEPLSLP